MNRPYRKGDAPNGGRWLAFHSYPNRHYRRLAKKLGISPFEALYGLPFK